MTMAAWLGRHPRLTLVGDACLGSAAGFGAAMGTAALLLGDREPPVWIAIPASLLTLGTVLVGPALAWMLRGRRLTWIAVLGAVLATLLVMVGTQILAFLAMGLAWVLTPLTSAEFAGPIALLALSSLGFIAMCCVPILGIPGMLGDPERGRVGNRLLAMRVAALGILVAFAVGAGVFIASSTDPERAEVYIFAMIGGFTGAAMAFGADLAQSWRRSSA